MIVLLHISILISDTILRKEIENRRSGMILPLATCLVRKFRTRTVREIVKCHCVFCYTTVKETKKNVSWRRQVKPCRETTSSAQTSD